MSKHAKLVLWVGLFLILMTIVQNWSTISTALLQQPAGTKKQVLPPIGGKVGPGAKCPKGYIMDWKTQQCFKINVPGM